MALKKLPPTPRKLLDPGRLVELMDLDIPIGLGKRPYYHWEQLRHRKPPGEYSVEEWWSVCQFRRGIESHELPMASESGTHFRYCLTDRIRRSLHEIDQKAAGSISASGLPDDDMRLQFLVDGHILEAITSAQLEGASTGHAVAASMLRSGADPEDKDQLMIVNTYLAMNQIASMPDELKTADICSLHEQVTRGTLDNALNAGHIQSPNEERVCVRDNRSGAILHEPPPAKLLPKRIQALCDFANEAKPEKRFLHPVLRAIALHFWLAYDHPFVDGNGRAARMLYYWLAEKRGFWMLQYVPISTVLRKQPAKYGMAYQYVESDRNDLTYFFEYQLEVILKMLHEFLEHVRRRTDEVNRLQTRLRSEGFNHRQLAVLSHALRNPTANYSAKTHSISHDVSMPTARSDLTQLAEAGYLKLSGRQGKMQIYSRNRAKLRGSA